MCVFHSQADNKELPCVCLTPRLITGSCVYVCLTLRLITGSYLVCVCVSHSQADNRELPLCVCVCLTC